MGMDDPAPDKEGSRPLIPTSAFPNARTRVRDAAELVVAPRNEPCSKVMSAVYAETQERELRVIAPHQRCHINFAPFKSYYYHTFFRVPQQCRIISRNNDAVRSDRLSASPTKSVGE
jgi:hypothetical protein